MKMFDFRNLLQPNALVSWYDRSFDISRKGKTSEDFAKFRHLIIAVYFLISVLVNCYQLVTTKYIITCNLQSGVTTAAMTDQDMEYLDSQFEVSKFFSKYFKRFHQTKTGTIFCNSKISFTFYEMNLALYYLLN